MKGLHTQANLTTLSPGNRGKAIPPVGNTPARNNSRVFVEDTSMAERPESSVMASIQDILKDAQTREEEEKLAAQRLAEAEEQARIEAVHKQQEAEEARMRSEEEERQRRAFDEQKRQAELAALQEAKIQSAKIEAEASVRLVELNARQAHERQLAVVKNDEHKKRLTGIAAGLGVLALVAAVGGGYYAKKKSDEAQAAQAELATLQDKASKAEAERSQLKAQLENAKDPKEFEILQQKLAAKDKEVKDLNSTIAKGGGKPVIPGGGAGGQVNPPGGGGGGGGGGGTKPACKCPPGDPMCTCY